MKSFADLLREMESKESKTTPSNVAKDRFTVDVRIEQAQLYLQGNDPLISGISINLGARQALLEFVRKADDILGVEIVPYNGSLPPQQCRQLCQLLSEILEEDIAEIIKNGWDMVYKMYPEDPTQFYEELDFKEFKANMPKVIKFIKTIQSMEMTPEMADYLHKKFCLNLDRMLPARTIAGSTVVKINIDGKTSCVGVLKGNASKGVETTPNVAVAANEDNRIRYTVSTLKEKATFQLEEEKDCLSTAISIYLASKMALRQFLEKAEDILGVQIVPYAVSLPSQQCRQLCPLLSRVLDSDTAAIIQHGWDVVYKMHQKCLGEYLSKPNIEKCREDLATVITFINIIQSMEMTPEMAEYLHKNFCQIDLNKMASEINMESELGKANTIIRSFSMEREKRCELNEIYKERFGEDLATVLFKNKEGVERLWNGE